MEHRIILGGEQYLPFARSCVAKLKKLGLAYASQTFVVDGVTISVKITPGHEYIRMEGGESPLYQFFTTGPERGTFVDPAGGMSAVPGYAVRVRLSDKPKKTDDEPLKLVGVPTGSTAEKSEEDPPKWRYSADTGDMAGFLMFKTFQVNGINQHQFYMNAKGPRFYETGWVAAGQIGDMAGSGISPVRQYARDAMYDASVYVFKKPGRPSGNPNGFAPDADWYRRGAATRVKPPEQHPEYGERLLLMLTDVSGNLYVYPTDGNEQITDPDRPYADQAIKTTIPDKNVKKQKIPYPSWARPFPAQLRRDAIVTQGADLDQPYGSMRWEFSSDGKRMVCLIPSDLPSPIYGSSEDEPDLQGVEIGIRECKTGMLELAINITVTGEGPDQFDVQLEVLNEVKPTDEQYIIAAQYYWGDIEDVHAPTKLKKDELVVMDLNVYHHISQNTGTLEPSYLATRSIVKVRSFESGTVVREFTTHAADAPWGMVDVPYDGDHEQDNSLTTFYGPAYNGSFLKYYFKNVQSRLFLLYTANDLRPIGNPYGPSVMEPLYIRLVGEMQDFVSTGRSDPVTPSQIAELEAMAMDSISQMKALADSVADGHPGAADRKERIAQSVLRIKIELTNIFQATNDSVNVVGSLLACDLRALAFAVQTSAFHNDGPEITRQDRVQVIVRNEVVHTVDPADQKFRDVIAAHDAPWTPPVNWVKLDHRREINPSTSLLGYMCIGRYDQSSRLVFADSREETIPKTRTGWNVLYPVGASVYNFNAVTFVCSDPMDVFTVHPSGHWAISTRPVAYYAGASRHGRYGDVEIERIKETDKAAFTQHIVDIVSVQVYEIDKDAVKEGKIKTYAVKSSHLDLINEAYGKTWKHKDFYYTFDTKTTRLGGITLNEILIDVGSKSLPSVFSYWTDFYQDNTISKGGAPTPAARVADLNQASYMDTRNYFGSAISSEQGLTQYVEADDSVTTRLNVRADRTELYQSLIRGSALFGGTTIRLK